MHLRSFNPYRNYFNRLQYKCTLLKLKSCSDGRTVAKFRRFACVVLALFTSRTWCCVLAYSSPHCILCIWLYFSIGCCAWYQIWNFHLSLPFTVTNWARSCYVTRQKYPDLASTLLRTHSVLKHFHSGERIQKGRDSPDMRGRKPYPERKSFGFKNIQIRVDEAWILNFTFYGGRKQATSIFSLFSLDMVFGNPTQSLQMTLQWVWQYTVYPSVLKF